MGPSWPMLGLDWIHVALCWPRLDARWLLLAQAEAMLDLCRPMQAFRSLSDANPQWYLAPRASGHEGEGWGLHFFGRFPAGQ